MVSFNAMTTWEIVKLSVLLLIWRMEKKATFKTTGGKCYVDNGTGL